MSENLRQEILAVVKQMIEGRVATKDVDPVRELEKDLGVPRGAIAHLMIKDSYVPEWEARTIAASFTENLSVNFTAPISAIGELPEKREFALCAQWLSNQLLEGGLERLEEVSSELGPINCTNSLLDLSRGVVTGVPSLVFKGVLSRIEREIGTVDDVVTEPKQSEMPKEQSYMRQCRMKLGMTLSELIEALEGVDFQRKRVTIYNMDAGYQPTSVPTREALDRLMGAATTPSVQKPIDSCESNPISFIEPLRQVASVPETDPLLAVINRRVMEKLAKRPGARRDLRPIVIEALVDVYAALIDAACTEVEATLDEAVEKFLATYVAS